MLTARLACVKHAASVRSEPGSNSQVHPSQRSLANQSEASPSSHSTDNLSHPTQPTRPHQHSTRLHARRRPRIPPRSHKAKYKQPSQPINRDSQLISTQKNQMQMSKNKTSCHPRFNPGAKTLGGGLMFPTLRRGTQTSGSVSLRQDRRRLRWRAYMRGPNPCQEGK